MSYFRIPSKSKESKSMFMLNPYYNSIYIGAPFSDFNSTYDYFLKPRPYLGSVDSSYIKKQFTQESTPPKYLSRSPKHILPYWNSYPVKYSLAKPRIHSRLYKPPDFDYSNKIP